MTHDQAADPAGEALALVADLEGRGFSLEIEGEMVHVSPAGLLTDADREAIRRLKHEILTALPQNGRNGRTAGGDAQPPAWDEARADAALADATARLDKALARDADTPARRNVVEIYREVVRSYHWERNPLLWDVAQGIEALFARWRGGR